MARPVSLILGSSPLAERAYRRAQTENHQVVLWLSGPVTSTSEHTHIPLEDYSAFVAIFQKTLDVYGGIDNLILAFTPAAVSRETSYIPGTDHAAVDDVLGPLIKAVKLGYYHWRRDQRARPNRRLVILAAEGTDVDSMTSRNAVLGFWRSTTLRAEVLGIVPELVIADLSDRANDDRISSTLIISSSTGPIVHIISKGEIRSQPQHLGQCQSAAINAFGARLGPIIWLVETITSLFIASRRIIRSPQYGQVAATLRLLPAVIMAVLAAISYRAQLPIAALICSLIASRISFVAGAALLALAAYGALPGSASS